MRERLIAMAAVVAFCVPLAVELVPRDPKAFRFSSAEEGRWARVEAGEELCQRQIDVPVGFARVVAPGHRGTATVAVHGDRTAGGNVDVCLRNPGPGPLLLHGISGTDVPHSFASIGPRRLPDDVHLDFLREHPASMVARLDEVRDRLTRYKPAWIGRGTIVALALAIALGVPALIVVAVRRGVR